MKRDVEFGKLLAGMDIASVYISLMIGMPVRRIRKIVLTITTLSSSPFILEPQAHPNNK